MNPPKPFIPPLEQVLIVRADVSNPGELMNRFTEAQVLEQLMHDREVCFRRCDAETRRRRALVKAISVLAMEHLALANMDTVQRELIGLIVKR